MKKLLSFACAIAVGVALSSTSYADITDSGAGAPFTDQTPGSSDIVVGTSEIISNVEITLFGLDHTWVGDLQFTLTSADGTTVDIMNGIGDAGNVGFGDSSDFGGDYVFSDDGGDLWAAAGAAGAADVIAAGDYFASDINGALVSLDAAFFGEQTAGTWTLSWFDRADGDSGDFDSWELRITSSPAIPEPGSLAVIGLVGVACVIRRRR